MTACLIVELGFIGYAEAFELQKRVVAARKADAIGDVLLLCEHPHVITLGRSGKRENLLASERVLMGEFGGAGLSPYGPECMRLNSYFSWNSPILSDRRALEKFST